MRLITVIGLLLFSITTGVSQKKITVEDLYGKNTFETRSIYGINWMADGRFYSSQQGNKILKSEIASGNVVETILDAATIDENFHLNTYELSSDEQKVLLLTNRQSIYRRSFVADYYIHDLEAGTTTRLSEAGKESYATFSPDGTKVAFTRNNNLYYVDLDSEKQVQVTDDGKFNHIINGSTDWVYEEEFGFAKAFFWSPDGSKIAYYKFDESEVREYNMQVWNNLYPTDYRFKYPKAGEENSKVEIYVYDLEKKSHVKMDIGNEEDIYIPRVKWTREPDILSIKKLNRLQNHMELFHLNSETGKSKLILEEKSETYVDVEYCDDLTYLKDGSFFIHSSERDGFKHLYLYDLDGNLVRQITKGNWEVTEFLGVDEAAKTPVLYYLSTEVSPLERHFYKISITGKRKEKLTREPGMHNINVSSDFSYYLHYYSSADQPLRVSLHDLQAGKSVKMLEENQQLTARVEEYGITKKEFLTIENAGGDQLNAYFIKPADFDRNKKYPLLIFQYSGPGSQEVTNAFGGSHFYWHQMLAQKGYIIAVVDPRGTGARGAAFKKQTYKQLGKLESEDHIAVARKFAEMPFVDGNRIGIWGWSYGGYTSSLSLLKGNDVFKMAIAVAPVTNWRFYDTIYTERFMSTPQENPSGYDDNSPTSYADRLKGDFLLVHGTGDDNVHFQNAVVLQDALIAAGKQFDSFYYPNRAHGIYRGGARNHLFKMMTDYVLNNL